MRPESNPFGVDGSDLRQGVRERAIARVTNLVSNRPRTVIAVALLFALLGAWLGAMHLAIDGDTNSLISESRPFMQGYRAFQEEFGDLETVVIAIDPKSDAPTATHEAERAAQLIQEGLDALVRANSVQRVSGQITVAEQWRLAPWAMSSDALASLLQAHEGVSALAQANAPRALAQALDLVAAPIPARGDAAAAVLILDTLFASPLHDALLDTPLDAPHDTPHERASLDALSATRTPIFLRAPGGRLVFIEVLPAKDFTQLDPYAAALAPIRAVVARVSAQVPSVDIGLTGKPVLQADEMETSTADMTRASIASLVVITILFIVVFRGVRRPLLAVFAFAIASAWTYGAATLLVGHLTLLSTVFMLVLVGAGLDYGVHVISRYGELRRTHAHTDAVRHTLRTIAPGTLTGALSSAIVFFLALASDFGGLRELGLIAGVGLLLCALAMVTVLPALLIVCDAPSAAAPDTATDAPAAHHWTASWSWHEHRTSSRVLLWISLIAVGAALLLAPRGLRIATNLLDMQAENLSSVQWEHRILADSASASWFAASAAVDQTRVAELVTRAKAFPNSIARTSSILDVMAPSSAQRLAAQQQLAQTIAQAIARGEDATPPLDAPTIIDHAQCVRAQEAVTRLLVLTRAAAKLDARAEAGVKPLQSLSTRLAACSAALANSGEQAKAAQTALDACADRAALALREMRAGATGSMSDAVPSALRARMISPRGTFLVQYFPRQDAWKEEGLAQFVADARAVDAHATGVPVTQLESIRDMRHAFVLVSLLSIVAVTLIAWLDFRTMGATFLSTATVLAGVGMLLGIMPFLGETLNLANFFAIPMLIGLGIDSAIHILHRWHDNPRAMGPTIRAVAFTALTTAIGFGALMFAQHRGLRSLGVVMAVGSITCMFVACVVLPLMLYESARRKGDHTNSGSTPSGSAAKNFLP